MPLGSTDARICLHASLGPDPHLGHTRSIAVMTLAPFRRLGAAQYHEIPVNAIDALRDQIAEVTVGVPKVALRFVGASTEVRIGRETPAVADAHVYLAPCPDIAVV